MRNPARIACDADPARAAWRGWRSGHIDSDIAALGNRLGVSDEHDQRGPQSSAECFSGGCNGR
jgi:hypothetical protein